MQALLPLLATYLGHARYTDTAYYVTGTADLLGMAAGICRWRRLLSAHLSLVQLLKSFFRNRLTKQRNASPFNHRHLSRRLAQADTLRCRKHRA